MIKTDILLENLNLNYFFNVLKYNISNSDKLTTGRSIGYKKKKKVNTSENSPLRARFYKHLVVKMYSEV